MPDTLIDTSLLPSWDLTDLYPSATDPKLTADLKRAEEQSAAFQQRYKGKLSTLSGDAIAGAISTFEAISEILWRIGSFAGLKRAENLLDGEVARFAQAMEEKTTAISQYLTFFMLELNELEQTELDQQLAASAALRHYAPFIRDSRAFRDHQMSEELTRFSNEIHIPSASAWSRLFDETLARLTFPLQAPDETEPKPLSLTEAADWLSDKDQRKRKHAGEVIGQVLGEHRPLFTHITNTLAKNKEILDRWQRWPRVESARNRMNYVEDEVVDALITAVTDAMPRLSHRYYALKAKWLGGETLPYYDRNAPLPDEDDRIIGWDNAVDMVMDAYAGFSPALGTVARKFFDNRWIDAPVRPGKAPGAFAHPTVPSAHPYLLLNYQGRVRDVMTLAHELGHGVHQVLAGGQGNLMAQTPLTLAETASVFGEMLTFQALLAGQDDPRKKRALLAGKVEDMLNTVVRQIAFCKFEQQVHNRRRQAELSEEEVCEIWLNVQRESLGPALAFDEGYQNFWTYIPHFIHSPFYVYAYAFGDCLVNALFAVYQDSPDGFDARYVDLLRAGGSLRHKELLAPFGLDASDPAFWQRGLKLIEGMIDQLEADG